jgi:hypothetical protein
MVISIAAFGLTADMFKNRRILIEETLDRLKKHKSGSAKP